MALIVPIGWHVYITRHWPKTVTVLAPRPPIWAFFFRISTFIRGRSQMTSPVGGGEGGKQKWHMNQCGTNRFMPRKNPKIEKDLFNFFLRKKAIFSAFFQDFALKSVIFVNFEAVFAKFSKKTQLNRFSARETSSARRTSSCRTVSYAQIAPTWCTGKSVHWKFPYSIHQHLLTIIVLSGYKWPIHRNISITSYPIVCVGWMRPFYN